MAIFFKMNTLEGSAISQTLKLAQKFNNFYLNGKFDSLNTYSTSQARDG
jgi:hypothetical protein